jgi:hypothetical protein
MPGAGTRTTLGSVLRLALDKRLPEGWLFLPRIDELAVDTPCLLLEAAAFDASELDDRGIPVVAVEQGFPCEGLDSATIEDTAQWARGLAPLPSDAALLDSFAYYLKFDAFLPALGAPDPPPWAEVQHRLDREFYEALGAERPGVPCRKDGCRRGAVEQSVFCRPHHFASVKGRQCPFSD